MLIDDNYCGQGNDPHTEAGKKRGFIRLILFGLPKAL